MRKNTLLTFLCITIMIAIAEIILSILGIKTLTVLAIISNLIIVTAIIISCGVHMINAERIISMNIEKANDSMELAMSSYAMDMLTTACNRAKYKNDLKAQKNNTVHALYCSLSNLEELNITHGEEYADNILANAVKSIRSCIEDACIYRTGSSEFMVVINHITNTEKLKEEVLLLQEKLKELVPKDVSSSWNIFSCKGIFKENLLSVMRKEAKENKMIFKNFLYD